MHETTLETDETASEKTKISSDTVIIGGGLGLIAGILLTAGAMFSSSPNVDRTQVFQRGNEPAVMRMYRTGADGIYVEDQREKGSYIKLETYLARMENEADRNIEDAKIRRAVGWYSD